MANVYVSHNLPFSEIIYTKRTIKLIMSVIPAVAFPSPRPTLNADKSINEDL